MSVYVLVTETSGNIQYEKGVVLEYQLQNRVEKGKVFNPVLKLVFENYPFLMPEPAEKPSLQYTVYSNLKCQCTAQYSTSCMRNNNVRYLKCMHYLIHQMLTRHISTALHQPSHTNLYILEDSKAK